VNAADSGATRPHLERLISRRAAEYLQLWEGAAAKFSAGTYRSEDLLDDWFTLCGNATRDVTAGVALLWGAAAGSPPPPPEGAAARCPDESG